MTMRTIDDIISGDALTWANLTTDELRREHELLRRHVETQREQIALWAPIVAWRRRIEAERDQLRAALVEACDRWAGAVHMCDDPNLDREASLERIAALRKLAEGKP